MSKSAEHKSKQLALPSPGNVSRGFQVNHFGTALKITGPYIPKENPFTCFGLIWNGSLIGIAVLTLAVEHWQIAIVALAMVIVAFPFFTYPVLTKYINKIEIQVDRGGLETRLGPLPVRFWRPHRFKAAQIKQVYVTAAASPKASLSILSLLISDLKQSIWLNKGDSSKNLSGYTYRLRLITSANEDYPLLEGLTDLQQALYLEQEIERCLGLEDDLLPEEASLDLLAPLSAEGQANWQKLAAANRLDFIPRASLKGAYIAGVYRGRYLELDTFAKKEAGLYGHYTRLLLSAHRFEPESGSQPVAQLDELFTPVGAAEALAPLGPGSRFRGLLKVKAGGGELYYEQAEVEAEVDYMQFLFDTLSDLLDAYPKLVALGGEVIPILQTTLAGDHHASQGLVQQLLTEIEQETTGRLSEAAPALRCSRCLGHPAAHQVELASLPATTYYGCQNCGQSRDFFEFTGRVAAVLDGEMSIEQSQQAAQLRVNWLARRTLFHFDEVEIIRATDEQVERFAVQVANDTDPERQPRYQTMDCWVWAGCNLSENSLRILQRVFGQVEMSEVKPQDFFEG